METITGQVFPFVPLSTHPFRLSFCICGGRKDKRPYQYERGDKYVDMCKVIGGCGTRGGPGLHILWPQPADCCCLLFLEVRASARLERISPLSNKTRSHNNKQHTITPSFKVETRRANVKPRTGAYIYIYKY